MGFPFEGERPSCFLFPIERRLFSGDSGAPGARVGTRRNQPCKSRGPRAIRARSFLRVSYRVMTEADIRDFLAERLDLVEPGLQLISKEYPLQNPDGASGRIDILARDRFGNLVVIELKKSDAAARTALNEVLKYLALLQSQKRLQPEQLRCVLVSTDWRELLVPFSELVNTSPFSLQGRLLQLDGGGMPTRTDVVNTLPPKSGLSFPSEFSWLTFASIEARDHVADQLRRILPKLGLENAAFLLMTSLNPDDLVFPFSMVLPFFPFARGEAISILQQKVFPVKLLADFEGCDVQRDPLDDVRHAVQSSLESEIFCMEGVGDVHPVQNSTLHAERKWWQLDSVYRHGPGLADERLLSDNALLSSLCGGDGANEVEAVRVVDPSHKMQFAAFTDVMDRFLSRYGWWDAVEPFVRATPVVPGTTIVAHAYCPKDFLKHLALFLKTGSEAWLPAFEVMMATPSGSERIVGGLAWDGTTEPPPVDDVLPDRGVGGNILRLVMSEPSDMRKIVDSYGLVFPTVRQRDGELDSSTPFPTIATWEAAHRGRVDELRQRLGPVASFNLD